MTPELTFQATFSGELFTWRGPSPYHFIAVPPEVGDEIRSLASLLTYGWGVIPVRGLVGGTSFTTSLFPKDGGYLLPIKDAVRKGEALQVGDVVAVELTVGR